MKEVFRHYAVEWGNDVRYITTCLLLEDGTESRGVAISAGISICCPQDNYNKKLGNKIARNRAHIAIVELKTSSPIRQDKDDWRKRIGFESKCTYYPLNGGVSAIDW